MRKGLGLLAAVLLVGFGLDAWQRAEAFFFCGSFSSGGGARGRGLHRRPPSLGLPVAPWRGGVQLPPASAVPPSGAGPHQAAKAPRRNPWRVLVEPAEADVGPVAPPLGTKESQDR